MRTRSSGVRTGLKSLAATTTCGNTALVVLMLLTPSRGPRNTLTRLARVYRSCIRGAYHLAGPCGAPSCTHATTAAGAASQCHVLGVVLKDCCVSSALLCQNADLSAGSSGGVARTAAQGGGSDTLAMQFADSVVQQWLTPGPSVLPALECGLPHSSPLASVATEVREEDVHTFFDRVVAGYASGTFVSPSQRAALNLRTDAKGLSWALDECLLVPDFDRLRKECFESVMAHSYFCMHTVQPEYAYSNAVSSGIRWPAAAVKAVLAPLAPEAALAPTPCFGLTSLSLCMINTCDAMSYELSGAHGACLASPRHPKTLGPVYALQIASMCSHG